MKGLFFTFAFSMACFLPASAQSSSPALSTEDVSESVAHGDRAFSRMDYDITVGSTGLGLEVSTPLSSVVSLRGGFSFWPHFQHDMNFKIAVGDDSDEKVSKSRFQKMAAMMKDMTGYTVDNNVTMEGKPKMWNFSFLVDIKPFTDKRWHITTGFYWGNSTIAYAENSKGDMTSLFAVGIYNRMYECAMNDEPYLILNEGTENETDYYFPSDVVQKFQNLGRMGVHVGTYAHDITDADGNVIHAKGTPYNMEPDANSMVSARAKVNPFKPYIGFGFDNRMSKKLPKWTIGFDAGVAFWGGTPQVLTHDGTDLVTDVTNLRHNVGRYVKFFKLLKVMPVINLKLTHNLFR